MGLSACSFMFKPIDRSLEFHVPDKWRNSLEDGDAAKGMGWIRHFNDSRLENLVHEACEQNYDLRIYLARLETAQATDTRAGADRWPSFSWGIRGKKGETKDEIPSGPLKGEVMSEKYRNYGLFLGTDWEFDLWGKLRDRAEAGKADLEASRMELLGVKKSLSSMVAKAWYNAVASRLQLGLARETLKNHESVVSVVRSRYESGVGDALDLKLSVSQAADSRSLVHLRIMEHRREIFRLQTLLGRYPDGFMKVAAVLPEIDHDMTPGIPSMLLESRPDVLEKKYRLMAADCRILESKKSLLPSLNLTGDVGSSSRKLRNITDPDYFINNILGSITQPVFDGFRMEAEIREAESLAWEAYLDYSKTVLKAFREVEEALAMDAILADRKSTLKNAVALSTGAENMAWEKYALDVIDIFDILETQRRILNNKTEYLAARHALLMNRIDLYLALGLDPGKDLMDGKNKSESQTTKHTKILQ